MTAPLNPSRTTFSSGDLTAGRFRIRRFLARGGMGEVYEATDELLDTRVALKTLRAHVADDAQALERFRREILSARQVTHPNVCRIFDVFHHRRTQDPSETPVTFLTMELLSGETLADRLRTRGRMSPAEALPIVAQVVSALSAAHKAGIVHRDVKSGNVMLVPSSDGTDRAVVTDFGLARAVDPGEGSSTGGEMVGTSAYMAPEQVKGGTITPAADIYALGIVMYEMVTGTRPFTGDSPVAIALQRLEQPPAPPSTYVTDLDPTWERTILRCLEREPRDRFPEADDALRALVGSADSGAEAARPGSRPRAWLLAAVAGALVLAAIAGWRWPRPHTAEPPAASVRREAGSRRAVAVLGFRSLSGNPESAWLSAALSEMLATELAIGERLRVVPGEHVTRMKRDVASAAEDSLAPETLEVIRSRLGADVVVLGTYLALGPRSDGRIRLDLRICETARGETVASLAETGSEADLLDLVARTGSWLRNRLGVESDPEAEARAARASLPSTSEGARLYAEGVERLRLFEALAAKDLLVRAVEADPGYPLARLALADAWSALGYDGRARTEAQRAFDASAKLSREERLLTEARYREAARQWDKALEIYRVLCGFFPDNLDYGLRLAEVQTVSGMGKDALATLQQLRRLPSPRGDHPQIDLGEASAAQSLSNFELQRDASRRAVVKGRRLGAPLVVAAGRRGEGLALMSLGDLGAAAAAFDEAQQMFAAAGDRRAAAQALSSLASVLWKRGELSDAMKKDEQALAVFDELGDRAGLAVSLNHMGILLQIKGDRAAARARYQQSLAIYRELGEKQGVAVGLMKVADLAVAEADFLNARKGYEEAERLGGECGAESLVAFAQARLGDVLSTQDELTAAHERYQKALTIRERIGEKDQVAESQLALATLALEEGQAREAERLARLSATGFERHELHDSQASAYAVLAEALWASGNEQEGRRSMQSALELSAASQRPRVRLSVAIAAARLRLGLGDAGDVHKELLDVIEQTRQGGLLKLQLEARLALGQAEIASGQASSGRRRLESVERDARKRGFALLARKAKAGSTARTTAR